MHNIRKQLAAALQTGQFTTVNREASMTDITGNTTVEIVNASFIADEPALFGIVDYGYVAREEEWYYSQSLNVRDIPGGTPAAWEAIADQDGLINSNYGWAIYSEANGKQYDHVVAELKQHPDSRRAIMLYTRPSMWVDYNAGTTKKRADFMCTNSVQYMIRNGVLHAIVQMRSNDAVWGFKNDRAWQLHVQTKLAAELNIGVGPLHWNAGSLHVYARHYYLLHHYLCTGEAAITAQAFKELYPHFNFPKGSYGQSTNV